MSIPLTTCLIRKALTDPLALKELVRRMEYNAKFGAFSIWPCRCEGKHLPLSESEHDALIKMMEKEEEK